MKFLFASLLTIVSLGLQAQCVIDSALIAITNITVIPMTDTSTVWNNQTVIIQNRSISQIGNTAGVSVPPSAYTVDGSGKYLIPGLCDMHTHLLQRNDVILELANGVTTVCNMHGEPWHVGFRDSINSGQVQLFSNTLYAPRIYTTGPIMNYMGHPFFNPPVIQNQTQAMSSLQSQDSIGYDFYKPYTYLTNGVFNAIQNHALSSGKFLKGHGNDWIGATGIINSSQKCIEHFWGYLPNDTLDPIQQELEDSTIAKGKWNCPTLIVRWNREHLDSIRANEPSYVDYVCPSAVLNNWRDTAANPGQFSNSAEYMKLFKRLYQNNGKLMLGTDNVTPYSVAGFSLHRELELCVDAGLTPHQALTLAIAAPYQFLQECGLGNDAGTVAVGKRADLLILDSDPLADIRHTKSIYGVIGNGSYYPLSCLNYLLSNTGCNLHVGFSELHTDEEILHVYPNPAKSMVTVEGLPDGSEGTMLVINQMGQHILQTGFVCRLNLSDLPAGVYYLLAYDGHACYSQKIVKE